MWTSAAGQLFTLIEVIRRDWWWDVVPATVVAVAGTLGAIHIEAEAGERTADGVTFVFVGVASVALLGRRRRPLPTLVVVMAALVAYTLRNDPGGPVYLAGPVALYSLAVARPRVVGYVAAAAVTAVQVVARVVADGDGSSLLDLLFAGWAAVAVLAADAMRARQERMRHQEDEDRRGSPRSGCSSPATSTTASPTPWRRSTCRRASPPTSSTRQPEQAAEALEAIRVASRDVLDELARDARRARATRRRPRSAADAGPGTPRRSSWPAPRRAGLHVDLHVDGDARRRAAGRRRPPPTASCRRR